MKESKETIESEHPSFFTSLMNKSPVFYKKDIKSIAFVEETRKKLVNFHKEHSSVTSFHDLWLEFCKAEAIERLSTLGRDIANKREREIYREKLEKLINPKEIPKDSTYEI